jgi:alpha-glucoside transport system substrate-binding protein
VELENVTDPISKLSVEILQDESAEFRFDASDLMPAAVGAGSFWQGMTEWIEGAETDKVLSDIESSYP